VTATLAIDPGNRESAYVLIGAQRQPLTFGKVTNEELRNGLMSRLVNLADGVAIEMVASYGMAVGADVFETVLWTGRLYERSCTFGRVPQLVYRRDVKLHHCQSAKAKDSNIRQALLDRFGDKGTKAAPGWFYGFKADVWQAYALAVYVADTTEVSS